MDIEHIFEIAGGAIFSAGATVASVRGNIKSLRAALNTHIATTQEWRNQTNSQLNTILAKMIPNK